MPSEPIRFRKTTLPELAEVARQQGPQGWVVHERSLAPVRVAVPGLRFGNAFLQRWPVWEEPAGASWTEAAYTSLAPAVFTLRGALVHSDAGIVCVDGAVIVETLEHADPAAHGWRDDGDGVWLDISAVADLPSMCASALAGAGDNHYHLLVDGVGRLSAAGQAIGASRTLLCAANGTQVARGVQEALCGAWGIGWTGVARRQTGQVDKLLLASAIHGQASFHPCLTELYRATVKPALLCGARREWPHAFYVSRASAPARRLLNEPDLMAALALLGVVPVALEGMCAADQAALFDGAALVVAPHGAGLANLLFARPHCMVLELLPDRCCNWCFRRLSAVLGLRYDCIIGRGDDVRANPSATARDGAWRISVPHVAGAVVSLLSGVPG